MIIYKDIISGDELFSDEYATREIDNVSYEFSLADPEESLTKCRELIEKHHLETVNLDKSLFVIRVSAYLRRMKDILVEKKIGAQEVEDFEENSRTFLMKLITDYENYNCYVGKSKNPEGMIVMMYKGRAGVPANMLFWKYGFEA